MDKENSFKSLKNNFAKNIFTFTKVENCIKLFQNVYATQGDNIVNGNKIIILL